MEHRSLNLTFDRVLCSRHGEPFRSKWPAGYALAMLEITRWLLASESFQEACEKDVAKIEELLDEQPACCRLPQKELMRVYSLAAEATKDFGRMAPCDACGMRKIGTPYSTRTAKHDHICFECVIYRMVPTN